VPFWPLDPGWEKVSIRIRDEQPGSYFLELGKHFFAFFGVKILKFFDEDPGWRQFGSGMEKVGSGINIPDPPNCPKVNRIFASNFDNGHSDQFIK
jgi:hypothetical protein